jgi:hypothetical protein
VEIPRRRSTTGESPLYDLCFRWDASTPYRDPTICRLIPALCPETPAARSDRSGIACCFDNSNGIIRNTSVALIGAAGQNIRTGERALLLDCERVLPRLKVSPA